MTVSITANGQEHSYVIPVFDIPITFHPPHPWPNNYPTVLFDLALIASLHAAASKLSDDDVRNALHSGIQAALEAAQKRAGNHIKVSALMGDGGPTGGRTGPGARS